MTRIVTAPFHVNASAGTVISVPEAKVGDSVSYIVNNVTGAFAGPQFLPAAVWFAPVVIVDGEILQTGNGVVTDTYVAVLERDSVTTHTVSFSGVII